MPYDKSAPDAEVVEWLLTAVNIDGSKRLEMGERKVAGAALRALYC